MGSRRLGLWVAWVMCGAACSTDDVEQRLDARGEVILRDGTSAGVVTIAEYALTFVLEDGAILDHVFDGVDASAAGFVTGADGRFAIADDDLALRYDVSWIETVCDDECIAWEQVCVEIVEQVCVEVCSREECTTECTQMCHEENVCHTEHDDAGEPYEECWPEQVCDESCREVCTVVEEPCNCHDEVRDSCTEECAATGSVCRDVTYTDTRYPGFDEVVETATRVTLVGEDGSFRELFGEQVEAYAAPDCVERGECDGDEVWVQRDRFVLDGD